MTCNPYWGAALTSTDEVLLSHSTCKQVYHSLSWHFLNSRVHLSHLLLSFPNFWWFPIFFFLFNPHWLFLQYLFLIDGWLLYNSGLISAIYPPKHPVLCIEPGLATCFIHDILHVSMPFSQIFPPSPSLSDIQSEVSQKEKHQYSILTHIYGI